LKNDTTVVKNAQFAPFFYGFCATLRHATPRHVTTGAPNIVRVKVSTFLL
jgi:hypothetical protein